MRDQALISIDRKLATWPNGTDYLAEVTLDVDANELSSGR